MDDSDSCGRIGERDPNLALQAKEKKCLKAMLEVPTYEFGRRIETLQGSIGADRKETEHLLRQLGARQSISDARVWMLKSPLGLA